MWEVIEAWEDICTTPLGESTALLLEFSDGCMLLVCANGESSGELVPESTIQLTGIGSQSSEYERESS